VGGRYGVGKRISIKYTRAILNAALNGELEGVEYYRDPVFGFEVPKTCPGVPDAVMNPASSWPDQNAYMLAYRALASRFIDNFRKFAEGTPEEVSAAGPRIEPGPVDRPNFVGL
jgi:phosphoenolpyruvate carboxykinase (ATP)